MQANQLEITHKSCTPRWSIPIFSSHTLYTGDDHPDGLFSESGFNYSVHTVLHVHLIQVYNFVGGLASTRTVPRRHAAQSSSRGHWSAPSSAQTQVILDR